MIKRDNFRMLSKEEESQFKFHFCRLCSFYECELVEEYMKFQKKHIAPATNVRSTKKDNLDIASLSYNQEELKNRCIMMEFNQIECGRKKVADGIGDHYKIQTRGNLEIETDTKDRWEPSQPIFISAQTGQGKNWFIENNLISYVKELNEKNKTNQKILILSNRLALKHQIKNRLNGNEDLDNEEGKIYPHNKYADVMTYQSVLDKEDHLKNEQSKKISRYIYIVCDEAHFFTSDAMFNPHTQEILSVIVKIFKDAIRVYMSATPYECLEYIVKYEKLYKPKSKYSSLVFYHFKRDYNYLRINYYANINELYNTIVTSVNNHGEKWLIFIDDINKCKTIKEELEEYACKKYIPMTLEDRNSEISKILVVDATSKKNKSYESLVLNEKLNKNTYVLITTSVLDNGVNLTGIDNIVVSDMLKVKCLQMVGRARVKGDDQKTLYIKRFDEKYVKNRIYDVEKQKDAYHSYEMAYNGPDNGEPYGRVYYEYSFLNKYYNGDESDWKNAKHWFGRGRKSPTKLYLNEIARSLVNKLFLSYERILEEMQKTDEGQKVSGQKYLEYQLSWFGRKYNEENDITLTGTNKAQKEFVDFLEFNSVNERKMFDDDQKAFSKKFTELYDQAFSRKDPNKERDYGLSKMNNILKEYKMEYKVESCRETSENKKTYWKVVKFNWESDE